MGRSLTSRLCTGAGINRTRLHDRKGQLLDAGGFVYLPHVLLSTVWTKIVGHRPEVPWLGYRTIRWLDRNIRPDWHILEFGSGMSSLWFARRVTKGRLVSVESSPEWYEKVRSEFEKRGQAHVDYRLRPADVYPAAVDDIPDGSFDLVLVDGLRRDDCIPVALRKVKPGGYVLLDNSDADDDEHRRAERLLIEGSAGRSTWVRHKTDFYPGMILVCESLLVQTAR